MIMYALIAAAAIALLWPSQKPKKAPPAFDMSSLEQPPLPRVPLYLDAVSSLQTVQKRLAATDCLDDEQRSAIDTLTLALSAGSSQE